MRFSSPGLTREIVDDVERIRSSATSGADHRIARLMELCGVLDSPATITICSNPQRGKNASFVIRLIFTGVISGHLRLGIYGPVCLCETIRINGIVRTSPYAIRVTVAPAL